MILWSSKLENSWNHGVIKAHFPSNFVLNINMQHQINILKKENLRNTRKCLMNFPINFLNVLCTWSLCEIWILMVVWEVCYSFSCKFLQLGSRFLVLVTWSSIILTIFFELAQSCRNQGARWTPLSPDFGKISSHYYNWVTGVVNAHHITSCPPDFETFLRPCNLLTN